MRVKKFIISILIVLSVSGCENLVSRAPAETKVFMNANNPAHVLYAASYVGLQESQDRDQLRRLVGVDPVRTEWCAAFLNAVLKRHGIPGSNTVSEYPLLARSFLKWGEAVKEPRRGDIVIFRRGNSEWQGHVAIYLNTVERNGVTYYRILGGNQNDSVNVIEYPVSALLGIRRINNPLQTQVQGVRLTLR